MPISKHVWLTVVAVLSIAIMCFARRNKGISSIRLAIMKANNEEIKQAFTKNRETGWLYGEGR